MRIQGSDRVGAKRPVESDGGTRTPSIAGEQLLPRAATLTGSAGHGRRDTKGGRVMRTQEPRRWLLLAAVCLAIGCMTEPEECADCEAEMAAAREKHGIPEVVEVYDSTTDYHLRDWWYGKYTCGPQKYRIRFEWGGALDSCRVSTLSYFGAAGAADRL